MLCKAHLREGTLPRSHSKVKKRLEPDPKSLLPPVPLHHTTQSLARVTSPV